MKMGINQIQIAKFIGVNISTISREFRRLIEFLNVKMEDVEVGARAAVYDGVGVGEDEDEDEVGIVVVDIRIGVGVGVRSIYSGLSGNRTRVAQSALMNVA
jgi:hypothetical protein